MTNKSMISFVLGINEIIQASVTKWRIVQFMQNLGKLPAIHWYMYESTLWKVHGQTEKQFLKHPMVPPKSLPVASEAAASLRARCSAKISLRGISHLATSMDSIAGVPGSSHGGGIDSHASKSWGIAHVRKENSDLLWESLQNWKQNS